MRNIFVGIDPSINSTGVTVKDGDNIYFYIIKGGMKLSKKELKAQNDIVNFSYICYEKEDIKTDNNHINEFNKTENLLLIINIIKSILDRYTDCIVNVVIEGISYGSSLRTKSVFDLAGLNYMIRMFLITEYVNVNMTIATPSEMKKYSTGKGNANKELIVKYFLMRFPIMEYIPKVDDIADSYYMACYAEKIRL